MPCFNVNVHVRPSSETTGISAARSGRSSLPPASVVWPLYESSVRTRQHRKYSHVTDEYSFCGSNASCTSLMSAMCSVPPGWGSALVADGPVVEPPVSPPPHAAPSTAVTVASAMRIHLLDISSSSGIASDASTPTDRVRSTRDARDFGSLPRVVGLLRERSDFLPSGRNRRAHRRKRPALNSL